MTPADPIADNAGKAFSLPRLVIAAPQGRSGKTTVSLGLCAALSARGLAIQPFKKGPDYIDPSWLSQASGRPCRSLDSFFLPDPSDLRAALIKGASQADFALIEGNHGLYDSLEVDGLGSTAAVARELQAPIILVINAARMSRSVAAVVHGYQTFEPGTPLAGVILNYVAQGRHETKMRQAIEHYCRLPVLGALPRDANLTIPDRHLGLIPHNEDERLAPAIQACRQAVEKYVEVEAVLQIARSAPPLQTSPAHINIQKSQSYTTPSPTGDHPKIGVIRDQAFSFYYPENLEALQVQGAELIIINSLQDSHLPDVNALYIGGGFPEVFLEALSSNHSLLTDIRQAVDSGLPIYAECGGLMYLARSIKYQGRRLEMVGALPIEIEMTDRPQGHGYILAECAAENPIFPVGASLRGHEFHHSRITKNDVPSTPRLRLLRGEGIGNYTDGLFYRNIFAGYTHLHAYGAPQWATGLVAWASTYQRRSR
jgi:cobyrinic acid a,c-diamide synthase